ncbi:lytic transglycosylase domain-containing protein [Mucilaginibacter sp. dw_454]|uniref:lytic transglycosylase domain-containing protein n=1 Tax=Mucilaginibacter sp. dw_454 TaxID=2720079 RepID=UPI001BD28400|nr:lytic transglycosylase domain-containing protein [Mucilaginibacter sp. dw_454]
MKRIITVAAFILSLQIVKAHSLTAAPANLGWAEAYYSPNISGDTSLALPVGAYAGSIFKLRLDSIQKDVPLDYNEYVQDYIDIYTRHRDEMSHVMALSNYYFPIYEKIFRDAGIPTEIKYLSIVESKLDPTAVSRVGATGPWQFMATTAKIYGLNMDGYRDERRDPIQASYAAAAYLKDAYQEFGDWLLAIASYNCGKSSVERAIEKANAMDFWSIRPYLPNETRNYVPAFIAMSYVMNYGKKHSIVPDILNFNPKTDTLMIDRMVDMANVAKALNTNLSDLTMLNPSYTRLIVNGTPGAPRRLVIPSVNQKNYPSLYNVLNGINDPVLSQPLPTVVALSVPTKAPVSAYLALQPAARATTVAYVPAARPAGSSTEDVYVIKQGETLEQVAAHHGLNVHDVRAWNNIPDGQLTAGSKVTLNPAIKINKS